MTVAKITYSALVSSIAGSIGSLTFRRSTAGAVLYNRPLPTCRSSPPQLYHRSLLAASSAAWSALDSDIQRAWNSFAKHETLPGYFTRARTWRGKDLFTCFFLYAQHQGTPLPPRWLPRSPLFAFSKYFEFALALPSGVGDTSTLCRFTFGYPASLSSLDPFDIRTDNVVSVFSGYCPLGVFKIPRRVVKVAPAPADLSSLFSSPPGRPSGFQYIGWNRILGRLLGVPPGLPFPTVAPVNPVFSAMAHAFSLTDERLYYSGPCFGSSSYIYNLGGSQTHSQNNTLPSQDPTVVYDLSALNIPVTEY